MKNDACYRCPRLCGVDRTRSVGRCGAKELPHVAKVMLHRWEEPCICYKDGCGAIFFSGCPMHCMFCQNHAISEKSCGTEFDAKSLSDLMLSLQKKNASVIDLVSPTPYSDTVAAALSLAKNNGLTIPVVYNTSGYELPEVIQSLSGLVDVYMPDFKCFDPALAETICQARDYPAVCREAIREMVRSVGAPILSEDKLLRGVIVRILVLPSQSADACRVLDALYEDFGKDGVVLSLMRQYTPAHKAKSLSPWNRKLTTIEYQRVVSYAQSLGFETIFTQKKESASERYIPDFSVQND